MKKKVLHFIHGMTMGGAETLIKEYCLKIDKENSKSNFSSELINIQINNKIEQREKLHYENNKA